MEVDGIMAELFGLGIFLVALVFFVFILLSMSVKIVRQHERGLIERLGRYHRTATPGLSIILPFFDRMIFINMREHVVDVEPQEVITKDNVVVIVDAIIYYMVTDPMKVTYNIENFRIAATKLAKTNLRDLIGELELDESLTSRDTINKRLASILDKATDPWGVKITRVELQKIDPPHDITEAMSRQMKAERIKRAMILEADGDKKSAILRAEGDKASKILTAEGTRQMDILEAEGRAKAVTLTAEAKAEAIKRVSESATKFFLERPEAFKKLEVIQESLMNNTKYVIPSGSQVLNVLGLDGIPTGKISEPKKKPSDDLKTAQFRQAHDTATTKEKKKKPKEDMPIDELVKMTDWRL
ncbi:MAG: SPFH domain-containing protein [Candidatus Altiarchaeota archaeon]